MSKPQQQPLAAAISVLVGVVLLVWLLAVATAAGLDPVWGVAIVAILGIGSLYMRSRRKR